MNIIVKKILGVFCLIVGLIALVTPLTPGAFLIIFVGLELLGISFLLPKKVHHWLDAMRNKFLKNSDAQHKKTQ